MTLLERIHGTLVHPSRVRTLSSVLAGLIPPGASVLDVGSGDGRVGQLISRSRTDIHLAGIDTTVREGAAIPVREFDGRVIPFDSRSWDVVMFVDVLHHTGEPVQLLREAARVSRKAILIKDHLLQGGFARRVLSFMDWVGNRRHGVELPYNYWTRERWLDEFARLGLEIVVWNGRLGLYPPPTSWIFERDLHFVARLDPWPGRSR
jgi:SAM-dependent methyltransferase